MHFPLFWSLLCRPQTPGPWVLPIPVLIHVLPSFPLRGFWSPVRHQGQVRMDPSPASCAGLLPFSAFGRLGVICISPGPEQPLRQASPPLPPLAPPTSALKGSGPRILREDGGSARAWSSLKKWALFLGWALYSAVTPAPAPGPSMGWMHNKWVLN